MSEGRQARWERMTAADIDAVLAVADVVHPAFPEDRAVLAERFALHPEGCFVLRGGDGPNGDGPNGDGPNESAVIGYTLTHPWAADTVPPLNTLLGRLPEAQVYYIHDLALLPAARGLRAGSAAVRLYETRARALGLSHMALVAVNNSGGFWRAQGFEQAHSPEWAEKLASYGTDAAYMVKAV